jgi:hypothetical protein
MGTYQEILGWARSREAWQQEAIRRLVKTDALNEDDFGSLLAMVKAKHGLGDAAAAATPLAEADLPQQEASGHPVRLVRLGPAQNVGLLAPTESLEFAPVGLTVIYGDNASGKSSFARVLKRMCRARGTHAKLEPNVFAQTAAGLPSATVEFEVADARQAVTWVDGEAPPTPLSSIAVFDDHAAAAYVAEKQEVPLLPAGLDLLPKLVRTCLQMRGRFEAELAALEPLLRGDLLAVAPGTKVSALLQVLSARTLPADVDRLATLSDDEQSRLEALRVEVARLLAEDPGVRAKEARQRAARFQGLAERLRTAAAIISDSQLEELRRLRENAVALANAARIAGTTAFTDEPLQGIGTREWKALWEAAAGYSTAHAYPGKTFPVVGDGRCVLCQQPLLPEAQDRMKRFEEFVRKEAARNAVTSDKAFMVAAAQLRDARLRVQGDETLIDEVRGLSADLAERIGRSIDEAVARQTACVEWASATDAQNLGVEPLSKCPDADLDALAAKLRARADELDTQRDPGVLKGLRSEVAELDARRALAMAKEAVLGRVKAFRQAEALRACISDVDTGVITKKNAELTKKAVTEGLRAQFAKEARELRLRLDFVEVKPAGGKEGVLFHQLQLPNARQAKPLGTILSEGERKASALALFFAEGSLDAAKSALVLDDPVSSFDHLRREAVAVRIVALAAERQVIVFTHDLAFLLALAAEGESAGVGMHPHTLERRGETAGHRIPGLPFKGQNVGQRIGKLKAELQRIEAIHRCEGQSKYEPEARALYGLLRVTWERAVEEVLFGAVVERQRPSIETNRLKKVTVTPGDVARVVAGMAKSSRWLVGHDQPPMENTPVPGPEELSDDIDDLVEFVGEIRARQDGKAQPPTVLASRAPEKVPPAKS